MIFAQRRNCTLTPVLVLLLAAIGLGGCASLEYYGQAVRGHWGVMAARRPIADVLADPATPAPLRHKLALARAARDFASDQLTLPRNASYTVYTALDRRYVVWNVFAAPRLSLELKESCFLVVGCLGYRGYFSEPAARSAAAALRRDGYDVYVGGVAAYSTLGWFADPLLSSMLHWEDAVLVKTLFHELAHQRLYVPDDATFNESFATAVAEAGYARWREETAEGAGLPAHVSRDAEFIALVMRHRQALAALYESPGPATEKLAAKAVQLARLREEFAALGANWPDRADYARWLARDLNNAKLASVGTYHTHVPGFTALLVRRDGDFPRFFAAVDRLADLPRASRDACLEALAAGPAHVPGPCGNVLGAPE
ncbi:MAG: aminopeptidase [Gammaproteobacteria bacterium]